MCEFKFDHDKDPKEIYEKARIAIVGNGGEVTGDECNGAFTIEKLGMSVEGRFEIGEKEVKLFIDQKPFFVSCKQIQDMIGNSFTVGGTPS